jgi:hypothetical protein
MPLKFSRPWPVAGVALLFLGSEAAVAQEPGSEVAVHQREVFRYPSSGRQDPFGSWLGAGELAARLEDITLWGIVHHTDPTRSVAVLQQKGATRPIHARIGDRIGPIRLLAIHPERVEVMVEELGVLRRDVIFLSTDAAEGASP